MVDANFQINGAEDTGYVVEYSEQYGPEFYSNEPLGIGAYNMDDIINYLSFFSNFHVTLPQSCTINSANISFRVYGGEGYPKGRIYGVDAANPSYPEYYEDVEAWTLTSQYADWNNIPISGTWINTPDISNIISALVSSYNYSSGANLIIFGKGVYNEEDSSSDSWFYDYSTNSSYAPILNISYSTGGGSSSIAAIAMKNFRGRRVA